jgi:hypothetical protein
VGEQPNLRKRAIFWAHQLTLASGPSSRNPVTVIGVRLHRVGIGCLLGIGGMGLSACSSAATNPATSVPTTIQEDPSHQVRLSSVGCTIEQEGGAFTVVTDHGDAKNTSSADVLVSPQASFNNREGQQLANAGTNSGSALKPGDTWSWTATEPAVSVRQGITDTRIAKCVVSVLVSGAPGS